MDYKELRKEKGMTQVKAAILVGVTMRTWQMWEQGAMKPSEENMKKIQAVFGNGGNEQ